MSLFFTSPDVVGMQDELKEGFYTPTIYTVSADIHGLEGVQKVTKVGIIRALNASPVIERRYLKRPTGQPHEWLELIKILKIIPDQSDEIDTTNSSRRQHIWSGDGKITDIRGIMGRSEEIQYSPFGEYFTSTDALLDALEHSWRKLDSGSWSHGFPAKMHHFYIND